MGAKAIVAELAKRSPHGWKFIIQNCLITTDIDGRFLQGILVENTPYSRISYVWVVTVPWFEICGSFMAFGHRIRHCGGFEGGAEQIADMITETIESDECLKRILFEPMSLEGIVGFDERILRYPENFPAAQIFDLAVLYVLDGQKIAARDMLIRLLERAGSFPLWPRERAITRAIVHCLDNEQSLQPVLDPLIAANKVNWFAKPVKPRGFGAEKPKARRIAKPVNASSK